MERVIFVEVLHFLDSALSLHNSIFGF